MKSMHSLVYIAVIFMLFHVSAYAEQLGSAQPLTIDTKSGTVHIKWEPVEITPNRIVTFEVGFMDQSTPIDNIHYDFIVLKDGVTIKEVRDSFAMLGRATHTVEFPSSGSFTIIVNLKSNGEIIDTASFNLKVAPEFPAGTIIVTVTLLAATIVLTRLTLSRKNLHTH